MADDYAIVIGIDHYPELESISGAVRDARAFRDWLTASGVPEQNVALLASEGGVKKSEIEDAFDDLVKRDMPVGRRLYLYMTGAGIQLDVEEFVFIASDTSPQMLKGIAVRAYADWFTRARAFEEVVLIADVRRTILIRPHVPGPPYDSIQSELPAAKFYVMSKGPRGALTGILLDGLSGAAAGKDGTLDSEMLGSYLYGEWNHVAGEAPEIEATHDRPIVFNAPVKPRELPPAEQVRTYSDDPARLDELGRRPFAEVIGQRLDAFWKNKTKEAGAFMVNVDGPWGSGKTSVLNLLRTHLQDRKKDPWVVVEFNAWRQQRLRPPWWALIKDVYRQSAASWRQIGIRSLWLRAHWLWWRAGVDWGPAILAISVIVLAIELTWIVVEDSAPNAANLALTILAAIGAAGATVFTFLRSLALGSARAAQTYTELRSDPLSPILLLFRRLVRATHNPIVIFIDDVDRCDTAYVIELLEGIQTLFRNESVAYVVAADRKWIVTCFEKTYETFSSAIGEPGRPLGYLFLEKVFQVSATLPLLPREIQQRYWSGLLLRGGAVVSDEERKKAEAEALASLRQLPQQTKEQYDVKIAEVKGDPVKEPAMRAAAAKQITSAAAQEVLKHRLEPFAELLEANPRAMKRLLNAVGFHQATHFLEGRSVSLEAMARWTIIELRWPLLSDYLAGDPSKIDAIGDSKTAGVPKELRKLFGDPEVTRVIKETFKGIAPLDAATVRGIVGTAIAQHAGA